MEELDYWRLCDELNVIQAALLVVGEAPTLAGYVEGWDIDKRPKGYEAAKTAIVHALKKYAAYLDAGERVTSEYEFDCLEALSRRSIEGVLIPEYETDMNGNQLGALEGTVDLWRSTVEVGSLKQWLKNRGFTSGFFFPDGSGDDPDYLDSNNPRYAPKLAAAVRAWQAMSDENLRRGKSAKSAMDQWLTANYKTLGLFHKRDNEKNKSKVGDMNKSAIQEAAKIANWEEDGGAPKTPLG